MLPQNPTKQQEIDHFRKFVEELPRTCYLRNMFAGSIGQISQMIKDDFAFEPLNLLLRQQDEAKKELEAVTKQVAEKRREVAELHSRTVHWESVEKDIKRRLEDLKNKAHRVIAELS